jgi:hypothetical protein
VYFVSGHRSPMFGPEPTDRDAAKLAGPRSTAAPAS